MYRAITIEDDHTSCRKLKKALTSFSEEICLVAEARDVSSGITCIAEYQPHIIFLSIELPDGIGFDILDQVKIENHKTIFLSESEEHALRAIKYNAYDYIMKPIHVKDITEVLDGIVNTNTEKMHEITSSNNKQLVSDEKPDEKLMIPNHNGYMMIEVEKIIAVQAEGSYVFFILDDGSRCLAAHSLSYYENLLPEHIFYRIHKSHIVNFTKVESVDPGRTGSVSLINGYTLEIAARRKSAFLAFLKNYASS